MFDIGVTAVTMDSAEQSFFAGCADGSIYQVELFRRVSTLVLLLQMLCLPWLVNRDLFYVTLCLFTNGSQEMSNCGKNISGTLDQWLVSHFFVLTTL